MISIGYGCGGVGKLCGYYGGTELGAERLGNHLISNGVDLDVVAAGSPQREFDVSMIHGPLWRLVWFVSAFVKCISAIKKDPDVIYARYATYPLFVGVILKLFYNKPLVVSVHGGDMRKPFLFDILIEFLIGHCDKVVCYDNNKHISKLEQKGFEPVVIPNGVEVDVFKPVKKKDKIKRVIYLGGKRTIKGYEDIIELSQIEDLWRNGILELHIYGEDFNKHSDGVYFHKYASRDELPSIMRKGDLFILPSYAEGVPGALLEAMASGMYVICSEIDYTRINIDFSYLFKAGDIERIVELVEMYESSAGGLFHNQSEDNVKFVRKNYSINGVGKKWVKLLETVLED